MIRKFTSAVLSLLLVMALASVVGGQDEETFSLTIMHTNDTHAHHTPNSDGDGGAARQATVVNQIRAEVDNHLLLDGGDRFTGTLFFVEYQGQDSVQIMNLLEYDAMTLGNHEFDKGDEVLSAFVDGVNFPVVTANVDFSDSPVLADKIPPYVVLDIDGEQVGIIGLVTPESEILSSPGDELVFEYDLVNVAQSYVDELEAQGVNKIILLTHIGFEADLLVAGGVDGVDVVVGGHTNTLLSNTYQDAFQDYPAVVEKDSGITLVVQAADSTEYLGRLDVEFDADGNLVDYEGDAIFLSRYITPDADMDALVGELEAPLEELRAQVVGEASVFLTGDRAVCRVQECNLGNLIADAVLADTGADIVFQNGGGIRANIDDGEVTLGEVLNVLPFGNLVSTMELSGADVIAALENGVSRVQVTEDGLIQREGASGRFPQVAGISYTFDPTQEPGSRIVEVLMADGTPLDPEATYFVATNDFMRNGGDGYEMFATNAVNPYDFGSPLDQVLADYIEANSPVMAETDGRITATVDYVSMD